MLSLKKTRKRRKVEVALCDSNSNENLCIYSSNFPVQPPGISNIASNCYVSSLLQCLCNHPTVIEACKSASREAGQEPVVKKLQEFVEEYLCFYSDRQLIVSPLSFLKELPICFKLGKQHDAHEVYIMLMNHLIDNAKMEIKSKFQADLISEFTCSECNTVSKITENQLCMELYTDNELEQTIQNLLMKHLEGEVESQCEKCKKQVKKEKSVSLNSTPNLLCIHVTSHIERETTTNTLTLQSSVLEIPGSKRVVYELIGIVTYVKLRSTCGHYTAFFKSAKAPNRWFYANDSKIIPVSVATVLQQQPFLAFYQLSNDHEKVLPFYVCHPILGCTMISDQIIDAYMRLVCNEALRIGQRLHVYGSQFYNKLMKTGNISVSNWYKNVNIQETDFLMFVINEQNCHWSLLVLDMHNNVVEYYDSLRIYNSSSWQIAKCYLQHKLHNSKIDFEKWRYEYKMDIPLQSNGFDCGIFLCQYALYRMWNDIMNFTQEDIGIIRKIMMEELLTGKLMSKVERAHILEQRVHGEYTAYYTKDIYLEPPPARKLHRNIHDLMPKQKQQTTQPIMPCVHPTKLPQAVPLSSNDGDAFAMKPQSDTFSSSAMLREDTIPEDSSNTSQPDTFSNDLSTAMPRTDAIPDDLSNISQPDTFSNDLSSAMPRTDAISDDLSNTSQPDTFSDDSSSSAMHLHNESSNTMPNSEDLSVPSEIMSPQFETEDNVSVSQLEAILEPPPTELSHSQPLPSSCTIISSQQPSKPYQCTICNSSYNQRSSLSRHMKLAGHTLPRGNITCNHENCTERFETTDQLIKHLQSYHKVSINLTKKHFSKMEDFTNWKEDFEIKSASSFVLQCAPKQRNDYVAYYYYCNRSGHYNPRGKGKRSLKLQGSSKLGTYCSAYIRLRKYESFIEAEICDYHTHETKLAHIRLPESIRCMIAAKLKDGVSITAILDSVRDNVETIGRKELISRQDIHNIKHQYNIEGIQLHSSDYTSVSLWVENIKANVSDNENPVLLFKKQGVLQDDETNDLSKEDFVLFIQTMFQRDMLMKFGNEVICMDSTHGTNVYDFYLVTILVLDEYREGIPVGWMITNREDAAAIRQCLLKVKEKCGDILTKHFMSDDADNFFNAWRSVFNTSNTKKLTCAWHLDKSWRKGLSQHITIKSKQPEVYHHLRVLLTETTESCFRQRLQQFISWLSEDTDLLEFTNYFEKEYVPRMQQWAPCFRSKSTVNTNMAVEAFHRLLKVCYMEKKQNRRIDRLLHLLLKIARDKVFERLLKCQKGKLSHRVCEINKRHKTAKQVDLTKQVITQMDHEWRVQSSSTEACYSVRQICNNCDCKLRCSICNICVHSYSCTCMDYLIHDTICKHIHLVKIWATSISKDVSTGETFDDALLINEEILYEKSLCEEENDTVDKPDINTDTTSLSYFNNQCKQLKTSHSEISSIKTRLLTTCKNIELEISKCASEEVLRSGERHLNAAAIVLRSLDNINHTITLPVRKRLAPNANIEKQLRFVSTKKKRPMKSRMAKPDQKQQSKCIEELENVEVIVCGMCMKRNDSKIGLDIDWIQCDTCNMWYHLNCANTTEDFDPENSLYFTCQLCSTP